MSGLSEIAYETALPGQPLRVFTLRGARSGPTLALIGAVHGDEYEGPIVLSRLLARLDPGRLAGRLIVCPAANIGAVAEARRCSPADGGNLARCFPGRAGAGPTEALAALVAEHVIAPADALVDLHSGGMALTCPPFAGYCDAPGELGATARAMAEAFRAPVLWRHAPPMPPGRTLSFAAERGIPAIYAEAGGGTFPPSDVLDLYRDGVVRVMASLGMLAADAAKPPAPPLRLSGDGDLDAALTAPATGLCTARIAPLARLAPGTACFEIHDLDGRLLETVCARRAAVAVFVRRSRWVNEGDLLMATAQEET
ncbi:hypothetical protein OG2516_00894 [Oceanicola granulosus HTCC2516]|uniref:Succinylglutamate desuccinylase/Aspartoacylase catalytic domain-containing protein n=1 Tax=Oceanicola granulosus (strain ATCC BAA-861 / DSM 15982 / KCTC 12143 / HTCC2516) TaxID=314256 RepID=Q2CJ61_OCEGH|nr:succinylglutamate desuccinylase/aspartoacylase family protein [Oceanicola granulosus]EAR52739.1 hypothetical protein OG2516_00894 [Oceanicola granulosus HTCC2516]